MSSIIKDIFTLEVGERTGLPDPRWETPSEFRAGMEQAQQAARVTLIRKILWHAYVAMPMVIWIAGLSYLTMSPSHDVVAYSPWALVAASTAAIVVHFTRVGLAPNLLATASEDYSRALILIHEIFILVISIAILSSLGMLYLNLLPVFAAYGLMGAGVGVALVASWYMIKLAAIWERATTSFLDGGSWLLRGSYLEFCHWAEQLTESDVNAVADGIDDRDLELACRALEHTLVAHVDGRKRYFRLEPSTKILSDKIKMQDYGDK